MEDYHRHTQQHIVCSMCGDIGFPEKLFRCNTCSNRFQHSYCSNYYREAAAAEPIETCDWCKSEEINKSKQAAASSSSLRKHTYSSSSAEKASAAAAGNRSEYSSASGGKIIKQHVKDDLLSEKEKGTSSSSKSISTATGGSGGGGGSPSPRTTATRRYKLLKDVISANK